MTLKKRALAELFTAQLAITTGIVHWSWSNTEAVNNKAIILKQFF